MLPMAPLAPLAADFNIRPVFQKLRERWYIWGTSMVFLLAISVVFVKTSPNIFQASTTLLIEDQSSGSKKAQELLELLEIKERGINIEDKIGLMKSYAIIEKTMERLDFAISYYENEPNLFNKFVKLQTTERYKDNPFRVIPNPAADQMIGVSIYVQKVSNTEVEISIKEKEVKVYNLSTRDLVARLPEVNFKKVIQIGKPYQDKYLNLKIVLNEGNTFNTGGIYFFKINDLTSLTNEYQGKLEAKPMDRDSRIIVLSSEGPIIEKEIRFLNKLVEVLVEKDLADKNKTGMKTLSFLETQLSKVGDSLRNSNTSLSSFRSANKILDVNDANNNIYQKLDLLENEKSRNDVQLKYYDNVLNQLQGQETITDVTSPSTLGIENQILTNLLTELMAMSRQMAGMATMATKDAPNIRVLNNKIENAKEAVVDNLQNNMAAARITGQELARRIGELEGNIYRLPENERKLLDLQGRSDFNSKTYNFFLEKRAEAQVSLASNASDMRRVDDAKMTGTGPVSPKGKQIYMVALILGFVLPAGLLIFLDKLDSSIRGKEDLVQLSHIPFLGIITDAGRTRKLPVIEKPLSAISESFRSLRVNLQYLAAGLDKKVIGITSSISGEGKTFCSVNIASEIAQSGKRVVLLELDLRRPTIPKYFQVNGQVGLTNYLIKAATLKEILQDTPLTNLKVITSGPVPPNPVELLSSDAMSVLIDKLKEDFDYIVFDIPPIGFVSEYFVLLKYIDASLFVVRYKYTSKDLLGNINTLYQEGKIPALYLVLNGLNYYEKYEYRNKGEKYYRA